MENLLRDYLSSLTGKQYTFNIIDRHNVSTTFIFRFEYKVFERRAFVRLKATTEKGYSHCKLPAAFNASVHKWLYAWLWKFEIQDNNAPETVGWFLRWPHTAHTPIILTSSDVLQGNVYFCGHIYLREYVDVFVIKVIFCFFMQSPPKSRCINHS